jgi:hypothetical protein
MGPRLHVVHPPDPLVIDLQVLNKLGARLPVTSAVARFRADGTPIQSATWYEAPFVDDGSGADLAASDRAYTATFRPTADQQAALLKGGEHVFVEVAFDAPNGLGPRKYGFAMMYSRRPEATLNGKYSDTAAGGNLVVNAGVTANKAGRYRLIGSLYAGDGQTAIAFATATAALGEGDGTVPLAFFGKVLNERGIDGPYELRYLMLFEQIREGEEVPGDTVDHAYTTAAYRAKSFSPASYQPPAPDFPIVDMNSPSQQGKPPPLFQRPMAGPAR